MDFINTLNVWQWTVLGLVPAAILALYFLKLQRQPLEVPSTYLWSRTIEDLHVNSIWQRLRQNLLLLLQLLLVALLMAACLRPGWRGAQLVGDRFIFLVDTSASMSATDVAPTRLEAAKRQILGLVDQMRSHDVAMVISFSNVARVEQSFTSNRALLRQKIARIQPTQRTTDLREALRAAAGLANPGRTGDAAHARDAQAGEAQPATLYLYTDGGFAPVPDVSLGNLTPRYVPLGGPAPRNVGFVAFSAERHPDQPEQWQAFARLANTGHEDVRLDVTLLRDGSLADAQTVTVPARGQAGVEFSLPGIERAWLHAVLDHADDLAGDNQAFAVIDPGRRARVLLATPGNLALQLALDTSQVRELADVSVVAPAELETRPHQDRALAASWDLIIYDRCQPPAMPAANTLFIGHVPPVTGWSQGARTIRPLIIDTDRVHPLMQYLELGDVLVVEGTALQTPPGGAALIDADIGPLLALAPRDGYEDAALGWELLGADEPGGPVEPQTDWVIRRSFPLFVLNAVRYLGGAARRGQAVSVRPGEPCVLRTESSTDRAFLQRPDGRRVPLTRQNPTPWIITDTEQRGIYRVLEDGGSLPRHFAVNLFDSRESDLQGPPSIELGHEQVAGAGGLQPARRELWRWLLGAGLVVLVCEWYVYNRRVYF